MKEIIPMLITALLLCLPLKISAQNEKTDPVVAVLDKYEDRDGVESITISPALIGLMSNKSNDRKTQDLISKISGLRIISINNRTDKEKPMYEQFLSELRPLLGNSYDQILKAKNEDSRVELYVKKNIEKLGKKGALIFITSENQSVTTMYLSGNIDKDLIDAVMNGDIGMSGK